MSEPTEKPLLPCPFCGQPVWIDSFMGDGFRLARVSWEQIRCENCQIETEPEQPGCRKPDLVTRWNTRAPSAELTQAQAEAAAMRAERDEARLNEMRIRQYMTIALETIRDYRRKHESKGHVCEYRKCCDSLHDHLVHESAILAIEPNPYGRIVKERDAALAEVAKSLSPRTTENTKPQ